MRKKLFFILAIVLVVLAIAGVNSMRTISKRNSGNKLFSDSSVKENLEDNEVIDDGSKIKQNVEEEKEKVKQEETYAGSDKVEEKNSGNDNSGSTSSSEKDNSSNAKTSISQEVPSSNNQKSSQANDISSNSAKVDKSVDQTHLDYRIHKGIIDCTEVSKCMDKSIPIQLAYKKAIANAYYVEVYAKDGSVLGYFIEYVFKEYTYSNFEECNDIGNKLKNTLSDRVTGYTCSSSGTLKINTTY